MDWTLRTKRRHNRLTAALLFFATLPGGGCANDVANRAHHRHIASATDDYRHVGTRREVVADAEALLHDRGYAIETASEGSVTTDWRSTGDETRDRLSVALRREGSGVAVRIDREQQQKLAPEWTPLSSKRDFELEAATLDAIYPGKSETLRAAEVLDFAYHVDAQILWDAVRTELQRRAYWTTSSAPPLDVTAATEWVLDESDPPRRSRYEVMIETDAGAKHLHVRRVVERGVGPGRWQTLQRRRDPSLEMALIAQRNPERAAEIESEADAEAQRAFQAARDAGLASCG